MHSPTISRIESPNFLIMNQTNDSSSRSESNLKTESDLRLEIERLSRELAAAQQERSQSAAYGLELLNEKENLQLKFESVEALHEQSKRDLQELREAWNKAVNEQRVSATTVFEKEVQLMNDSDALTASFTIAKQEIEKELRQTKLRLDSMTSEKERYLNERDELVKKVSLLEQERKNLKIELKDIKSRESKLFNENSELEEENVSLQKQVSNLRSTQVEFESSKHEIQRLQDVVTTLNSQLEEVITLRRITERQMQEALEALQSEREQKYALRKELDKRNSSDPLINWTSLAALKGSPHLANLALRNLSASNRSSVPRDSEDVSPTGFNDQDGGTSFSDVDHSYDIIHDLELPSIEGSLFDEVHLTEIKKLQQNLEEKEIQRSNLNTKLIEIQHKLDSKSRHVEEIEKKLNSICTLVEEIYNETENKAISSIKKEGSAGQPAGLDLASKINIEPEIVDPNSNESVGPKLNILDDFDKVFSHLRALFAELKLYKETRVSDKESAEIKKDAGQIPELSVGEQAIADGDQKIETTLEALQSDDVQSLRAMLYKKHEQLRTLRNVLKSNKQSAEVALMILKSKYDTEKAIVNETMTKLRLEHKRLSEDAATFASLRSHFSARIEEYNTEIEKLQSKLTASEQEKNTLNSILRMAIEQKVMLTQKLEALEMDRENPQVAGGNMGNKNANGQQLRSATMRGRAPVCRGARPTRVARQGLGERR